MASKIQIRKIKNWESSIHNPVRIALIKRIYQLTIVLISILSITSSNTQAYSYVDNQYGNSSNQGNPISIYKDNPSSSLVHISVYAPDFNSNLYAIDTIGDVNSGAKITISTRESSIPYELVETGPDTGIFAGYVILSATTSACNPICGPTDGRLAASSDDAITVSVTYEGGSTITATSSDQTGTLKDNLPIPEFGTLEGGIISLSMVGIVILSRSSFRF